MDEDQDDPPAPGLPGLTPIKTYSLEEVAAMVMPPDDLANAVRWLAHRIRSGKVSAYKAGRKWRMTHSDVEDLIERHRNNVRPRSNPVVVVPLTAPIGSDEGTYRGGLSYRSWLHHTRAETPGTSQYNRRYRGRPVPVPRPVPPPSWYKVVRPESEAIIFNMPELNDIQRELLERVRREKEVTVDGDYRKTVESLVRRNLVTYEASSGHRHTLRFTLRPKDS